MDRIAIETAVARLLGDLLLEGTIDSATTTQIADTELVFALAGQLRGNDLYIHTATSVTLAHQFRVVATSLVGSISVTPAFTIAPTVGDKYNLYSKFKHSDYLNAFNTAIRRAREIGMVEAIATLGLIATQWEYAVPSGFKYIHEIRVIPSVNTDYDLDDTYPLPRGSWLVRTMPNGTQVIAFDPRFVDLDDIDKEIAHVYGQRKPNDMIVPTANSEVPENFLIYQTAALLALQKITEGPEWDTRYKYFVTEARKAEGAIRRAPRPGSVEIR